MGRTAKTKIAETATQAENPVNEEGETVETATQAENPMNEEEADNLSDDVIALMKLYPQYEHLYITPKGFVHPSGVPEYLRKGAKLYKNKYYHK